MWVDQLPGEMIEQHSSICKLLIELIIIEDRITFPPKDHNNVYNRFEIQYGIIWSLEEHEDTPFWFKKNGHLIHLLPCSYEKRGKIGDQTIYITKVNGYDGYIMLVYEHYIRGSQFHIFGFVMKFAELKPVGEDISNNWQKRTYKSHSFRGSRSFPLRFRKQNSVLQAM